MRLEELKAKFINDGPFEKAVHVPNSRGSRMKRKSQKLRSLDQLSECGNDFTVPLGTFNLIGKAERIAYERGLKEGLRRGRRIAISEELERQRRIPLAERPKK